MFYSETLLSKTGPLARVWLSANIERKLSKNHVLQSDIESSVNAMVDQGQAPLALRLSGQLLLGVVRIYSRKARYLLDDCNEAILKIKMAFRPGNVDLPPNQSHTANPAFLTLPDVLTEVDLLAPMDPSLLLSQPGEDPWNPRSSLIDFGSSRRLSSSVERGRGASTERLELGGLDLKAGNLGRLATPSAYEREIEYGRDAPPSRSLAAEMDDTMQLYDGDDLGIDIGEELPTNIAESSVLHDLAGADANIADVDIPMMGMDDLDLAIPMDDVVVTSAPLARGRRASQSPLSSIRSSTERNLERTLHHSRNSPSFEQEEESIHHGHRAKKRKILQADANTEIHSSQIRAQQDDRTKIIQPVSLLPRDPILMALMEMQKTGGFVSSILGDGRSKGWAPELRGILSLEVIRESGELKRKRDAGIIFPKSLPQQEPEVTWEQSDLTAMPNEDEHFGGETTVLENGEVFNMPADDGYQAPGDDDGIQQLQHSRALGEQLEEPIANGNFDDTTAPLLHPSESGPISVGTKHAVHLLRETFSRDGAGSPGKRSKTSILFQDLLPEQRTTRADATKMFFEILVLATKDAIKVEQAEDVLGGDLHVRGKRGLWGSWAETEAGGQLASQEVAVV